MVPRHAAVKHVDVLSAMHAESPGWGAKRIALTVLAEDPFAHV
jgi:hypothetical protein